ncbi:M6 family metalloprotease domain-containing protein [Streptomyces sp. NPDC012510]|uniref:M6 family metalloprotease domain-containing protein n=1 Tax=Streptomyces sp. NPDC012510 TaxID=3364838 RepID=UPI0036E21460
MQRPLPWKELLGDRAPSVRSAAAMLTSLTALAATSLIAAPSVAVPLSEACTLRRTQAHHSEGLDTWNSAYPRPTRDLDAVLVFLSFPDAAPLTTPTELTADHFPATSEFFERASYGKFSLHPHPRREWLEMPRSSTAYAIRRDWNSEHRAAYLRDALATADPHVDFSRYDIVYFVADPHAPGVDSDATKVVNLESPVEVDGTGLRRVVTVFERHPPDRLVLAHETGHVFDLPDLYHRPADGKGDWDTHVGDWDLMGSQFALAPDLFAWHKWKLGWLEPRQVTCVRGTGSTRLTLEAVGAGPADGYEEEGGEFGDAGEGAGAGGDVRVGAVSGAGAGAGAGAASGARGGVGGGGGVDSGGGVAGVAAGARALGSGRGAKLAVVRTGPDSALGIEARGAVGNDASLCTQGVLVYRIRGGTESGGGPIEVLDAHPRTEACWEDSVYPPLADAPVGVGESFAVPGEAVRVAVEGRTASGAWTVRITTGDGRPTA